jgi:hypothetical protein
MDKEKAMDLKAAGLDYSPILNSEPHLAIQQLTLI